MQLATRTPWLATTPELVNVQEDRSAELYDRVINQFSVDTSKRYQPAGGLTFCNIFAWDVMTAMNAPLPHWVNGTGDPVHAGAPGGVELLANQVSDWLERYGARFSWKEGGPKDSQVHANAGRPSVVLYKAKPGTDRGIGHIAVVRPGEWKAGGPWIAQAGSRCFNRGPCDSGFGVRQIRFWLHP